MIHVASLWRIGNSTPVVGAAKQSTLSISIAIGIKCFILLLFRGIIGR